MSGPLSFLVEDNRIHNPENASLFSPDENPFHETSMKIKTSLFPFFILTPIILLTPIYVLAMPDPPDDTLEVSAPRFNVSEAIEKILAYAGKENTSSYDNAAKYVVVSAVYGRPDRIVLPALQGGSMEMTDKTSEPSWFVTVRSSEADSKRIYRLMDNGSIRPIMHKD